MTALVLALTCLLPQDPGSAPVPDEAAQEEAETLIREIFEKEFKNTAPAAQRDLAKKLLLQTDKNRNSPDVRYVLFREARDLFLEGNDVVRALEVQDRLEKEYALDGLKVRQELLSKAAARAEAGSNARTVAEAMVELVKALLADDEIEAAEELSKHAATVARRAKHIPLVKSTRELIARVSRQKKSMKAVLDARNVLKTDPDNPVANLEVGRYLCLQQGDWEAGLPHLAKGADKNLRVLALQDLAGAENSKEQIHIADGWWDLADSGENPHREALKRRAAHWYRRARAGLSGLTRVKVEKRLREAPASAAPDDPFLRGLIGHWTFDEDTGLQAKDGSLLGNDGQYANGARRGMGAIGQALELDGVDDHVLIPDSPSLNATDSALTLAAWVRPTRNAPRWTSLVCRQWGTSRGEQYALLLTPGGTFAGGLKTTTGGNTFTGPRAPLGRWTHLALTYDGKLGLLYVDGREVRRVTRTGALALEAKPLVIGAGVNEPADAVSEWFKGSIDEVLLYNRALSPNEIETLATKPGVAQTTPPGLPTASDPPLRVQGTNFSIETLEERGRAFGNRGYQWLSVPNTLRGWQFTRRHGGVRSNLEVTVSRTTYVYIATGPTTREGSADLSGWEAVSGLVFQYSDRERSKMTVHRRRLTAGATLTIPEGNWTGGILLAPKLEAVSR